MTQLTQPEPSPNRRRRSRGQAWSMSSPQAAQSSGPSQPMGSDWQAQVTQQSGPSGQPDSFQQSPQPDPIDLLAAQFSEGQSSGSFRGAPANAVGYGTPANAGGYGTPANNGRYGAPAGYGMSANAAGYGTPANGGYGAPTGSYGTPANNGRYGAPAGNGRYGGAPAGYGAPTGGYGTPANNGGYGAPAGYGMSANAGYGAPTGGYGAPANNGGYGAPAGYGMSANAGYGAPTGRYGTPANNGSYGTPTGPYGAPYGTGAPSGYGFTAPNGYVGAPASTNRYGATRATMGYGSSMSYGTTYRAPRYGGRTCVAALILGFVASFHGVLLGGGLLYGLGQIWGLWKTTDGYLVTMLPLELGGVIAAVIACHALGGASLMRPQLAPIVDTFHRLRWLVVVSGLEVALQLLAFTTGDYSLSPNWPLYLLHILLLCMMIGMFEEIVFRGIILNGLLAPLGERRDGVLKALLISSLLFGAAHLIGQDTDWSDRLQATQAILKVAQTGVLGFVFGVCAIHQRNLTGVAVFHGFTDFVLMVLPYMLSGPEQGEVQYVTADSQAAMTTIVMYSVLIALYIPALVTAMRTLRQEQLPQCGEFMDPCWTSAAFGARTAFAYS